MTSAASVRADKAGDAHRRRISEAYALRHPQRAREERALRKDSVAATRDFGHKRNGTPETHQKASRTQQGALARLFMAGSIDAHQLAASQEIRSVHERIVADAAIGTVSLETRVDQSRSYGGAFYEKLGQVRAEVAYSKWRGSLEKPGPVLAMIVEDVACLAAARRFGIGTPSARRLLISALDAWSGCNRDACDEVDEATLAAAQAAIL